MSLLVCFGSAIGKVPRFEVGHDSHGVSLFVVLVGETASGKGQALNVALRLLRRADPEWSKDCVAYGLASGEGLVDRLSDPSDADVFAIPPAKRLLCVETEFARPIAAMRRDHSTLSPILRSAWDGQTLEVMTRTKSKLRASNAHVSILAHVTEPELRKLIGGSVETTNGFANRFRWAIVRSTKSLPHGGDPDVLLRYSDRFAEALAKAKAIGRLKRSPEADRLWENVYPTLQRSICKATERGRPIVMRLATLYALTEGNPVIETEHLRAALAIWRYSEASAIRLFGDDDAAGSETLDAKIRRFVRQRPGLLRGELRNAVSRKVSKAEYDAAFKRLVSRGEIVIVQVHEACRPAERFYPAAGRERPYSVTPDRRAEPTASNGVKTTCPQSHADEDAPEYVLQNEDGTPFRSDEPETQSNFSGDAGEKATLGELLTWRNANGVDFVRKGDGSIWVTDAFATRLTPPIERAIRANQETICEFVPFDDFLTVSKPADESRALTDEEFVSELVNS